MATRTKTRSRSGAHVPCPTCGKKVRTAKGLAMHQVEVHAIDDAAAAAVESRPAMAEPEALP